MHIFRKEKDVENAETSPKTEVNQSAVEQDTVKRVFQHEQRITALELIIEDIRDKVLRKIQKPKRRW